MKEKVLTDEEIKNLGESLKKPRNEGAVQVSFLNLELSAACTSLTLLEFQKSAKGVYNKIKDKLFERIRHFVIIVKRQNGKFIVDNQMWESYLEEVNFFEESLEYAIEKNPNAIIIKNLWKSLFPVINDFVKLMTGQTNLS